MLRRCAFLVAVLSIFPTGCVENVASLDGLDARECTPFEVVSCRCPDAQPGNQVCRADGTGFDGCMCGCTPECGNLACGLDPVCGIPCGICETNETCSGQGVCLAQGIVLVGRTRPSAAIIVEAGRRIADSTSDERGVYSVAIASLPSDDVVTIRVQGTGDIASIELVSVLGDVATLVDRAGADGTLDESEHAGVVVDGIATAWAAGLADANAGALPATRDEHVVAEQYVNATLRMNTLLEAGLLFDRLPMASLPLPRPYRTTWALALDPLALRSFVRLFQPTPLDEDGPLAGSFETLRTQSNVTPPWAPSGPYFAELRRRREDRVGFDQGRLLFDDGQRGRFQPRSSGIVAPEQPFSWTTTGRGGLTLTFDTGTTVAVTVDGFAIAALVNDANLRAQIEATVGAQAVLVERNTTSKTFRRLVQGIRTEWVAQWNVYAWDLTSALAPFGIDAPAAQSFEITNSQLWVEEGAVARLPLAQGDVIGTWLLRVRMPARRAGIFGDYPPGTPVVAHSAMALFPGGDGSWGDGAAIPTGELRWSIVNSELTIDFLNGEAPQTYRLVERAGSEQGWIHTHGPPNDRRAHYSRDARVDISQVDISDLQTRPGTYWQTTINWGLDDSIGVGNFPEARIFGFSFGPDGTVDQIQFDDEAGRTDILSNVYQYSFARPTVFIDLAYSSGGSLGPCAASDPSCVVTRRRTWLPISLDNGVLTVYEWREFHRQWRDIESGFYIWNASAMRWEAPDGTRLDTNDYVDLFLTRLNYYILTNIP